MKTAKERYDEWLKLSTMTDDERASVEQLSPEEIEDHFFADLSFGTAGLRGKLGPGSNRMNERVIGRASLGLANTIAKRGEEGKKRGVAIAWDVRHKSREFMEIAARTFASQGVHVYIYPGPRPTPMLSFAVRRLNTQAGIVITASHNPKDYNGYKVYWEEGSQIRDEIADEIAEEISKLDYNTLEMKSLEEYIDLGMIDVISSDIGMEYIELTIAESLSQEVDKDISIVYTPLNGTGNIPVRQVLDEQRYVNVYVVPEQEKPDPDFTTVKFPNPEFEEAFTYAKDFGREVGADVLIATDPDCDRVAMMGLDDEGKYYSFTGNQTGALLINYILGRRKELGRIPENGAIVKSIVTDDFGAEIAAEYGVKTIPSLTGFKNICHWANVWDKTNEYTFLFGYEESIGYTYGNHVRDKDGVVASFLIAEMAAYYKKRGKTVYQILQELQEKFGYHEEKLVSLVREGIEGTKIISAIMDDFRDNPLTEVGGLRVIQTVDYLKDMPDIGFSNVLEYRLEDGSRFSIRPSGTEPKIKFYIYVVYENHMGEQDKIERIESSIMNRINAIEKKEGSH